MARLCVGTDHIDSRDSAICKMVSVYGVITLSKRVIRTMPSAQARIHYNHRFDPSTKTDIEIYIPFFNYCVF
jgi:hypothetical protein